MSSCQKVMSDDCCWQNEMFVSWSHETWYNVKIGSGQKKNVLPDAFRGGMKMYRRGLRCNYLVRLKPMQAYERACSREAQHEFKWIKCYDYLLCLFFESISSYIHTHLMQTSHYLHVANNNLQFAMNTHVPKNSIKDLILQANILNDR